MKKIILFLSLAVLTTVTGSLFAQEVDKTKKVQQNETLPQYRRSSLHSVLIKHPTLQYGNTIDSVFMSIPNPDKFNDHNIANAKSFTSSTSKAKRKGNKKHALNQKDINTFIIEQQIPKLMVAKWFNRCNTTYGFDLDLISERGLYDASSDEIKQANNNIRGLSIVKDAGVELIGKTFLIVNDITFLDHSKNAKKTGAIFKVAGAVAGALLNMDAIASLGADIGTIAENIEGFAVNITSYLYALNWDENILNDFYGNMWYEAGVIDDSKKSKFDSTDIFNLRYVGTTTTTAQNIAFEAFAKRTHTEQLTKVCTRAIDKSIVELQREYDEFKVNVPIGKIDREKKTVMVPIGLKEGVNNKSKYEILMPIEDKDGNITYSRIGTISPIKGKIWDNRFGALEEMLAMQEAEKTGEKTTMDNESKEGNASLTSSLFSIVTGSSKITDGCLVREITIKRQ